MASRGGPPAPILGSRILGRSRRKTSPQPSPSEGEGAGERRSVLAPQNWGGGAFLVFLLLFTALPTAAHDVKDPVCRMNTDTDTTPFRETINGKTYYFCSEACKTRFDKAPASYVKLQEALAEGKRRAYTVALTAPAHPAAQTPVPLTFTIREQPSGNVVTNYEVVHEEHLHLLLVSSDMKWFEHQHPVLGSDGRFRLRWSFPRPGRYYLFTDFTPADGDNQVLRTALDVGKTSVTPAAPHLTPDAGTTKTVRDTRVTLTIRPGQLKAGRQSVLTYTLTDLAGRPRKDMQKILGVMGHLVALRDDDQTLVHTHALHGVQAGSYGAATLAMMQAGQSEVVSVTPEMVTLTGPRFSFKLTPPRPGRYKLWAQFERQNQWLTVPFTVVVQ